jgi:glyoxylase-like metal-dependent hydrolase (beta-lactamase superfamily II)
MTKITSDVHLIENLDHPFPGLKIVPYLVEEGPNDLTLIDTCFSSELPKLKSYVVNAGYDFKNIKRIILTHVHIDHIQAANELKRLSYTHIGLKQDIWQVILSIKDHLTTKQFKGYLTSLEPKWRI